MDYVVSHHIKFKYRIKSIKYIEATENKIGNSNRELKVDYIIILGV